MYLSVVEGKGMETSQEPEESDKVRTTITLTRATFRRIRRAMALSERTFSSEIEFAMKRHLDGVEKEYGLSAKHLDDENWPE